MLRVLSLISLFLQFAEQHRSVMLDGSIRGELSERREKTPGRILMEDMLFPLSSPFSQFAAIQKSAPYAAGIPVAISNSQPTRCGHTLRGVHCRGWRVAAPLRTLQRRKGKSREA